MATVSEPGHDLLEDLTVALLELLRLRGVEVTVAGTVLRVVPAGALSERDRALLVAMKPLLLVLLEQRQRPAMIEPSRLTIECGWRS
jgi:hypothetical protein